MQGIEGRLFINKTFEVHTNRYLPIDIIATRDDPQLVIQEIMAMKRTDGFIRPI